MKTEEQVAIDYDELLARCLGNIEFVDRILTKFQRRFGEQLEELEDAVARDDAARVVHVAHRLKGESACVAATRLRDCVSEVEILGRTDRLGDLPPCLEQLREEWAAVAESLSARNWDGAGSSET
jgi:Amt family ammonium transporter